MEQIKQIDIRAEIEPQKGIGQIVLGLNFFYFQEILINTINKPKSFWEERNHWWEMITQDYMLAMGLGRFILNYKDIVWIYFNPVIGKVSAIQLFKGYKGKLWGKIKVNDSVKNLFNFVDSEEYIVRDGSLVFRKCNYIRFIVDEEYEDDLEYEELIKRRIRSIYFFDTDLVYPKGLKEMPERWKNSKPHELGC